MNSPTAFKNILIIRSATRILNSTIASLKNEFPNSKVTVLAPESSSKNLEKHPNIDAMISTGNASRMSVFSLKGKLIRKIRREKFDLAVSLYNIDHGMGYSNIDGLAWASRAKIIRGYNARGVFVEFNGWGVLKKIFLEKTSFAWLIINGISTAVLFALITLGLLCEWIIRKVFANSTMEKNSITKSKPIILPKGIESIKTSQSHLPGVH